MQIYSVIQKDGLNFVRLYFLNYIWYVNDLHNIWKKRSYIFKYHRQSARLAHSRAAASVEIKMATTQHKIFCVREFIKSAKLASSSNERRFGRLHYLTGRSSAPLAPGFSTFSEWISTSTMDGWRWERRSVASVLAPEISWSHTLRLFLVGVRKTNSLCTISTSNFGRPKRRITTAVNSLTQDILLWVWNEFSYRLDVTRAAGGGHIERL